MSRVSFIVPCFNGGDVVRGAVFSALASTHDDVEVIVVDDGSTDPRTLAALDRLRGISGVTVLAQDNAGVCIARNVGIRAATGQYLVALDHDDAVMPSYAAKAAAVLDARDEVGIVYSRAERFGASSGEWLLPAFDIGTMLTGNCITTAAMFRRDDWSAVGGFDDTMSAGWEDWDFWLSVLSLGREVVRLDEVLFRYRDTPGSMADSMDLGIRAQVYARIFERHLDLYQRHSAAFALALQVRMDLCWHLERRYGRVEGAIWRLAPLTRRLRTGYVRAR